MKESHRPSDLADIRARIGRFFVESHDFNGIPVDQLKLEFEDAAGEIAPYLRTLVIDGDATLVFASRDTNPHIKRLPELSAADQVAKMDDALAGKDLACVYPSASVVRALTDLSQYDDRPFTKRLALAEAQLAPVFFRLDVLERYALDPRFTFQFDDRDGMISYRTDDTPDRDKAFLQSFGIGYDEQRNRVVAVYLRYLSDLTPDHQQVWHAHRAEGTCTINSDYERASIYGEWPEHHSAYEALLQEQAEVNRLSVLIGKPMLFRESFETNRPRSFHPMLRATRKNYLEFAHLLDKMTSENIDKSFFDGDIELNERIQLADGVEVRPKGTLTLLREWIDTRYRDANQQSVGKELVEALREVRRIRQAPAHSMEDDVYDSTLPKQQDELVGRVIHGLTKLRLVLSSHPKAKDKYTAPEWLDGGKIVFY